MDCGGESATPPLCQRAERRSALSCQPWEIIWCCCPGRQIASGADKPRPTAQSPGVQTLPLILCGLLWLLSGSLRAAEAAADVSPTRPAAAASTPAASEPVAVPPPSEKALSYYHSGMRWWAFRTIWSFLVPAVILVTGLSARLRTWAARLGRRWFFTLALYSLAFLTLSWLADLPFDYLQGFVREHAYGVSNQTFGKWVSDAVMDLVVGLVAAVAVLWVPYLLLRKAPRRWWLISSCASVPFIVLMLLVQPIWIDPLFNQFGPMKDKALEADILALARRAGIEGSRVFEVNKSVDTKAVNAYVAGFGGTKRIVLWDTLLAKFDHDEILFVMGHEMGHYVLGHVWKLILLLTAVVFLSLYTIHRAADAVIARHRERFGFDSLADVASLPLLLLFFSATAFLLTPLINGLSRHYEHEADRFGLELRQQNRPAATAFVKLQIENLGNPWPGWVYTVFRATHPPAGERIEFCNTYRPWATGEPLRYADRFQAER